MSRTSPVNLALMLAGLLIWGAALNLLYGVQALGCELGWHAMAFGPMSLHRALLVVVWIAHMALHVALLAWLWRRLPAAGGEPGLDRFVQLMCVTTAATGLAATFVTGALVVVLSPCAP